MNVIGGVEWLVAQLWQQFRSNPFLAAFVVSFISNAIPYMTVPYLVLIAVAATQVSDPVGRLLLVLGGGVGAGLGKVVVYLMGRGVHRVLPEDVKENLDVFVKLFKRSMFIAVFLFAALPLPDDLLYVPLGVAGYSLKLFTVAVILGKIVITALAVAFGAAVEQLVGSGSLESNIIATAIIVAVSIIVTIIIVRMDWRRVARAYAERGLIGGTVVLIEEAARALLPGRRTSVQRA